MPWRRRIWISFLILVLTISGGVQIWTLFIDPMASGLVLGLRRDKNDYELVCGICLRGGDIWYFPYVIPYVFYGSGNRPRTLQFGDYQSDGLLGFRFIPYFPEKWDWYCAVVGPFWFLIGFSSVLLFQALRKSKFAPGLCAKCGYDLRASNERCPECGTAVVRESNPAVVC
jgi:hypothetical protein